VFLRPLDFVLPLFGADIASDADQIGTFVYVVGYRYFCLRERSGTASWAIDFSLAIVLRSLVVGEVSLALVTTEFGVVEVLLLISCQLGG